MYMYVECLACVVDITTEKSSSICNTMCETTPVITNTERNLHQRQEVFTHTCIHIMHMWETTILQYNTRGAIL